MIDYNKLWDEIDELAAKESEIQQKPHEHTANGLSKTWNLSIARTKLLLERLVEEGVMGKRVAKAMNGRDAIVYFPVQEEAPN